ncbi:MAG TPA: transposase [Candidatus Dormibacteraeota bacterium]|jgi:transposase|nr:transposase [Candidatus Dormibacteraeota bacterium]
MVDIGVDLHRKSSQVAVIDNSGTVLSNRKVPTASDELLRIFGEWEPADLEVAFEATFGWGWFADLLADAGIPAHMAHPLATKALVAGRVKNDKVDARTLAHRLRTGLLPEAWIAPPEVREARRLVRRRAGLVRIRTRLKCQVHAVLAEHGIRSPMADLFWPGGQRMLSKLELPTIAQGRLQACLRIIEELGEEVEVADQEIEQLFSGMSGCGGCFPSRAWASSRP